jgi:hypothetical protein
MSAGKGGGLPQVNLLPPEVRAARGLKVVRRWLLVGLVLVAITLAGGYFLSVLERTAAEVERDEARAETVQLQAEQERYSEVPVVLNALSDVQLARQVGMLTEISWKPYIDAITSVLPAGVSLDTINMNGATPVLLASAPESPLFGPSVAQINFTGRSLTIPDTAALIDALNSVPGFVDAWATSSVRADEEGTMYYAVSASVRVEASAYALRFFETEEED